MMRSIVHHLAIATLLTGAFSVSAAPRPASISTAPLQIELIVRTVNNFTERDEVNRFFERAHNAGVTAVYLNVKQDEDDERPSGQVYYASKIAPIAAGYEHFDALAAAVEEAHRHDIKLIAWMPQFHDQMAARAHPGWQMTAKKNGMATAYTGKRSVEYFVNPIDPEVQAYETSLVLEVVNHYAVDGVALDWLRFDDINMDVGPVTRALAKEELGIDPITLDFDHPSAGTRRWQVWRAAKIGAYTRQLRERMHAVRPAVRLTAFVLPPEFTEVGQNLAEFSNDLDEVLPMAYFKDWNFASSWVGGRLMQDVERKRTKHTIVKPTLDGTGTTEENVAILADLRKKYPGVASVAWFSAVYWQPQQIDRIVAIHQRAAATR
ncbi:MAG: family 10 glycosylhydrolase [Pseudomonadota bacterium]|nr:family 10 glycosylhydrolase [Pseudomonadota bacterium]